MDNQNVKKQKKSVYLFPVINIFSGFSLLIISLTMSVAIPDNSASRFLSYLAIYYLLVVPFMVYGIARKSFFALSMVAFSTGTNIIGFLTVFMMAELHAWSDISSLAVNSLIDSLWKNIRRSFLYSVQAKFKCCGIYGAWDWKTQKEYYKSTDLPSSCCANDYVCDVTSPQRFTEPCLEKFENHLRNSHLAFLVGIAIVVIQNLLLCIVFSIKAYNSYYGLPCINNTKRAQALVKFPRKDQPFWLQKESGGLRRGTQLYGDEIKTAALDAETEKLDNALKKLAGELADSKTHLEINLSTFDKDEDQNKETLSPMESQTGLAVDTKTTDKAAKNATESPTKGDKGEKKKKKMKKTKTGKSAKRNAKKKKEQKKKKSLSEEVEKQE